MNIMFKFQEAAGLEYQLPSSLLKLNTGHIHLRYMIRYIISATNIF
jgi:hypothetical protein